MIRPGMGTAILADFIKARRGWDQRDFAWKGKEAGWSGR